MAVEVLLSVGSSRRPRHRKRQRPRRKAKSAREMLPCPYVTVYGGGAEGSAVGTPRTCPISRLEPAAPPAGAMTVRAAGAPPQIGPPAPRAAASQLQLELQRTQAPRQPRASPRQAPCGGQPRYRS